MILVIFTVAIHERYRIQDDRTVNDGGTLDKLLKKKWHFFKGLFQIEVAYLLFLVSNVWGMLLFVSMFTLIHDAYINKTVLDRKMDFIGSTAWFDSALNKVFNNNHKIIFLIKIFLTVSFGFLYFYLTL